MNVSIIIVNYNGLDFTRQCLKSYFDHHSDKSIELIVVDNNSTDGTAQQLPALFPSVKFVSLQKNSGFGAANNAGASRSEGKYLFFLNNDTIFLRESISELTKIIDSNRDYGAIGPKLLNEDKSFQLSFGKYPTIVSEYEAQKISLNRRKQIQFDIAGDTIVTQEWVTGAAMMVRKEVFEHVNGFDEGYFMYFEDIDLCRKISKSGWKIGYCPSVQIVHLGGKSYTPKDPNIMSEYRNSQLRFYDKHNSITQRFILRLFLVGKYLTGAMIPSSRKHSLRVLSLLFRSKGRT